MILIENMDIYSASYERLTALQQALVTTGLFQLVSDDNIENYGDQFEQNRKITLKYQHFDKNVVLSEIPGCYLGMKIQSDARFLKSYGYIDGGRKVFLAAFQDAFFLYFENYDFIFGIQKNGTAYHFFNIYTSSGDGAVLDGSEVSNVHSNLSLIEYVENQGVLLIEPTFYREKTIGNLGRKNVYADLRSEHIREIAGVENLSDAVEIELASGRKILVTKGKIGIDLTGALV